MNEYFRESQFFPFRPWVRRAGVSIVLVAAAVTSTVSLLLLLVPSARWGWMGEKFVWIYIGTLWAGGLKVWLGTMRPVAELSGTAVTLRPLHQFGKRVIRWDSIRATEQMIGGDRLMIWFETPGGPRFVALNLNLVKGRRDLVARIDETLRSLGFGEHVVERSRFLRRAE